MTDFEEQIREHQILDKYGTDFNVYRAGKFVGVIRGMLSGNNVRFGLEVNLRHGDELHNDSTHLVVKEIFFNDQTRELFCSEAYCEPCTVIA